MGRADVSTWRGSTADEALWLAVARIGSHPRLCAGRSGFATEVGDQWLELQESGRPPAARVEALIEYVVVAGGVRERDVRSVVDAHRERLDRKGTGTGVSGRRGRLETKWKDARHG